jgi:hypothetical protein
MNNIMLPKWLAAMTTLLFFLSLMSVFIISIITDDKTISQLENRTLSHLPNMPTDSTTLAAFPKKLNVYYADHFGLRTWFTKNYKAIKYGLGDSTSEDVIRGKDGWLFLGSIKNDYQKYQDPIGDVRHVNLYTQAELNQFSTHMNHLNQWLEKQGIQYVFVIAPNKHSIYFDKLPDYITRLNPQSATDQLIAHLKHYTSIHVIDLRAHLIEKKNQYPLYSKTGTHWNFQGSNIAQYKILAQVQKLFPQKIAPQLYPQSIFKKQRPSLDIDLEKMLGISIQPLTYADHPIFDKIGTSIADYVKIIHKAQGQPFIIENPEQILTTLVFGDSFFLYLLPYFEQHFKSATYVQEKLNYLNLSKHINLKKPDIIIEEWVERYLPYVPPNTPEFD